MSRWSYYLPILGYHRVGPFKGDHVPTMSAKTFEWQLAFLVRHRYRVLSLEEMTDHLDRGEVLPRHSTAITFDDGYEETYTVAWPLLKRYRLPAVVFLTPAEVATPGFVTWEQATEMVKDGVTIGSHTMSHTYLPLVGEGSLSDELVGSKRLLEERLAHPVHFLSYPTGGLTAQVQAVASTAGYRAAFTTNRASPQHRHGLDRFALRRIKMTERDRHPLLFRAKLSGYYDAFRQLKAPG